MKLNTLIRHLKPLKTYNLRNIDVAGITNDSRRVLTGYMFVAIKGFKTDGHNFIRKSIEQGAAAIVCEKELDFQTKVPQIIVVNSREALSHLSCNYYGNPSQKINIIGITGTNGKTTTTFLAKSIIEAKGHKTGLIGTINYRIGSKVIPAKETTPESFELQNLMAEMVDSKIKYAVMEVSSHSSLQHRVKDIIFKTAVLTNISEEHIDYHETMANYVDAKLKLFKNLKRDAFAVLNADEKYSRYFADRTNAQILWYGLDNNADVKAKIHEEAVNKTIARFSYTSDEIDIDIPFIGKHNVYNALASAAGAITLGFDMEAIKEGIENAPIVPGRLEHIGCKAGFDIYIDFAHTPHALEAVLSTLRKIVKGKIILVFGCGGDRDKEKRPKMGKIADESSDVFWLTNDNPRSEEPLDIIKDIRAGVSPGRAFHIRTNRFRAIEEAICEAKSGDIVLIAGKGHEKNQIIKDTIIPFDDKEVVKKIINSVNKGYE